MVILVMDYIDLFFATAVMSAPPDEDEGEEADMNFSGLSSKPPARHLGSATVYSSSSSATTISTPSANSDPATSHNPPDTNNPPPPPTTKQFGQQ
jgi:hypothetical protein